MTELISKNLDVSAADVVSSGAQLYPATSRISSADQIVRTPNKNPASAEAREAILAAPGFGKYFSDNIVKCLL